MKRLGRVAALALIAGLANAQTAGTAASTHGTKKTAAHKKTTAHKTTTHKLSATEQQLEALRVQMKEQQAQLDALRTQLSARDQQVAAAQSTTATAQAQAADASVKADAAQAAAQQSTTQVETLTTKVNDVQQNATALQDTVIANQAQTLQQINSPTTIHYKGLTITPVAFFALEGVYRQRSVNSDINTPFNSIPFPSADEGHVSELNFSGRQSRLGGLFEGNAGNYKLSGYFETDFLGTGTSSNNNQSNSYVLRQRQIWGKAETAGGFAVTGGQMWSLVTENGKSTDNRTEKLPNTVDPQYMVGYSWTRQPAIRFQQRFGDPKTVAFTAAMSLEQAQITNFTANGTNPANYFFAGPGQNGGLYNAAAGAGAGNVASTSAITTYANNTAPDVVVKGAIDLPKAHFELGGIARFLRDFYNPVTAYTVTAGAPTFQYDLTRQLSHTASAGGVFGSARVSASKYMDVAVQAMAGQGVGRYGSSQLADATLRPDETLEPIRNYHGMFSLEGHPTKKLDAYAYYGGEYAQRTVYTTPAGFLIGYGPQNLNDGGCYNLPQVNPVAGSGGSIAPQTCGSPTRYIQEGMLGFTYRVVNSPKYGRLQYQFTYSYLQRNLWSGLGSATSPTGPRALDNMVHAGMRYYIP